MIARVLAGVRGRLEDRAVRRAGVPPEERGWPPALGWAAMACGLGIGPWLAWPTRCAAALVVVAFATSRPAGRRGLWVVVALAIVIGGWRADAIDRSAARLTAGTTGADGSQFADAAVDRPRQVTLREPLPAGAPERTASARATADGRSVVVMTTRFGRLSPALPRGAIAEIRGPILPLGAGGADARLRRQGVSGRLMSAEIRWSGDRRGGLLGQIDRFGSAAQRSLVEATGERRGGLLAGMALGLDDGIDEPDRAALRASGLWHLVRYRVGGHNTGPPRRGAGVGIHGRKSR